MIRPYREVRKEYISARTDVLSKRGGWQGNWRRTAKEAACREFDDFVQEERRVAVVEALASRPSRVWVETVQPWRIRLTTECGSRWWNIFTRPPTLRKIGGGSVHGLAVGPIMLYWGNDVHGRWASEDELSTNTTQESQIS